MAFPKDTHFELPLQLLSAKCKTLGSPARLRVLDLLSDENLYVNEIERQLPLSQGTVSAHLRKLREAGLIHVVEHGLYNQYGFDISTLERIVDELNEFVRYIRGEGVLALDGASTLVTCRTAK